MLNFNYKAKFYEQVNKSEVRSIILIKEESMKLVSSQLLNHISGEVTTMATCWKLTRRDNVVCGFTSHDYDIIFEGVTYASSAGFVPHAVSSNSNLSVDNLEIEGMIDGAIITEHDIIAGLYDFAQMEIFMVNYNDLAAGAINLRTGWIGEVKYGKGKFIAEVRGLMQSLIQVLGELFSPHCRAKFGDSRCGMNISDHIVTGSITSVIDNRNFIDSSRTEENGYFGMGKITFTSGKNSGLEMEVKEFTGGIITLVFPMPYSIDLGDRYSMQAGCDKSFDGCISRFNNAINFRGEPYIPGTDAMLTTAGTR